MMQPRRLGFLRVTRAYAVEMAVAFTAAAVAAVSGAGPLDNGEQSTWLTTFVLAGAVKLLPDLLRYIAWLQGTYGVASLAVPESAPDEGGDVMEEN